MLEVLEPGLYTTIQDAGRPDLGHLGVPAGGPVDRWTHAIANLLVGNEPDAPALELTVDGPTLLVRERCLVAVSGGDLGGRRLDRDVALARWRSHLLEPGERIAFPGRPAPGTGARAYLAVAGGIEAPIVLRAVATSPSAGLGGLHGDGRPIAAGEILRAGGGGVEATAAELDVMWIELTWPDPPADLPPPVVVRVVPGPHSAALDDVGGRGVDSLVEHDWRVDPSSDRVGLRLRHVSEADVGRDHQIDGQLPSLPMVRGAIQLPPDGRPIVLLADHQTIGGYPVPAVCIAADEPLLAGLGPGDVVRFELVETDSARAALGTRRAALEAGRTALTNLRATLGADAAWEGLSGWAGS